MNNVALKECPIIEAVFEIKFKSINNYTNIEKIKFLSELMLLLDIKDVKPFPTDGTNLPINLINNKEFEYIYYYEFEFSNYILKIGHSCLLISIKSNSELNENSENNKYPGWNIFENIIIKTIEKILDKIIFERITLRYINFFKEFNIFEELNLSISNNIKDNLLNNFFSDLSKLTIKKKIDIPKDNYLIENHIHISNDTLVNNKYTGSIIDINSNINLKQQMSIDSLKKIIVLIHTCEKDIFNNILTEKFYNKLKG